MWNSLRTRLTVILFSLAIGPLLLTGIILAQRSFVFEQRLAFDLQSQVAQSVSTEVESYFQEVVNDLSSLGNELRGQQTIDNAQQLSLMLGALSSGTYRDAYQELTLLDGQGKEQIRLSRQEITPTDELTDRSGTEEYVVSKSTQEAYFSPVQIDEITGNTFINIAIPLYRPRSVQLSGVLIAKVRFSTVGNLIGNAQIGEGQTVYVTNADGVVLARQDRAINLLGAQISLPTEPNRQTGINGTNVILASQPIQLGQQTLYLVAEKPSSQALALANATITTIIIVIAGALLVAGVFGFQAVQQIVRPIESLASTAKLVAEGDLSQKATVNRQDEIGTLATTFNSMTSQLSDVFSNLEQRVTERTIDLEASQQQSEKRAQQLQAISQISSTITREQNIESLLPLVTRLVSDQFKFYHVGIFIVDEARNFAVLQAANSQGGQTMLARGHRLEIGIGLVGTVAKTGKSRIALDVGSDAVFFNNPDLPDTHSEMALPLSVRSVTIGVLDVQSTETNAFTDDDAKTLSVLADQVAIAIENARLFGQTQQALEETRSLYRQYMQREWETYTQQASIVGYHQTAAKSTPLKSAIQSDEFRKAMQEGKIVVLDQDTTKDEPAIIVPVKLRDEVIGVFNIKAPSKSRKWSREEINMAQAISDRLALALENARLIEDSQRRATKEQMIGEITSKVGASINLRNVLQTAVEELARALPGSDVAIQLQSKKA